MVGLMVKITSAVLEENKKTGEDVVLVNSMMLSLVIVGNTSVVGDKEVEVALETLVMLESEINVVISAVSVGNTKVNVGVVPVN